MKKENTVMLYTNKKIIFFVLILIEFLLSDYSAFLTEPGEGGAGGAFMRKGIGAGPVSMANVVSYFVEDAYAIYYNPAGLTIIEKTDISISVWYISPDRFFNFIGVGIPLGEAGEFGLGIGLLNAIVTGISFYDEFDNFLKDGFYTGNCLFFSGGFTIARIRLGGSIKILYEQLGHAKGLGAGADFGAGISLPFLPISFGIMLQDIITFTKWDTDETFQQFPPVLKVSGGYTDIHGNLRIGVELEKNLIYKGVLFKIGGEYKIIPWLFIRAGASTEYLSTGIGILLEIFKLDYAILIRSGDISNIATISIKL